MKIGYIKINGSVSQLFINKEDGEIEAKAEQLRNVLSDTTALVEWNNQWTDKAMYEIIEFLGIK